MLTFLGLIIVSLLYPRIYISLLIFSSIIIPGSHSNTDIFGINLMGFNFNFIDLLFVSILTSILIKIFLFKIHKINFNNLSIKVLPYLIYNLICLLIGIIIYDDLSQSLYDSRVVFYYGILLINLKDFGFYLSIKNLVYTLFLGLFFYCLMVFSIFIFVESHPLFVYFKDGNSFTLGRLIFQQEYLFLIAFPLILSLITSNTISKKVKFLIFIALIAFFAKIFLSMSRGMIAFLILTILPYTIIKIKNHSLYLNKKVFFKNFKILFFGFIASVIIFIFVLPNLLDDSENVINYFVGRFTEIFQVDSSRFVATHISNRLIMWETGISEAFKALIFGHGYGYTFSIDYPEWSGMKLSFIDSTFITIIIRTGLLGLFLYSRVYFVVLKKIRAIIKHLKSNETFHSIYFRNLYISLIVLMFYSFTNSFLVFSISVFPLLLILNLSFNYEK